MSESATLDQLYITYPTILVYINELTPYPGNYQNHPQEQVRGLAESLATFQQFKPIVVWRCAKSETLPDGLQLHEGLLYIICGHGLWQGAMEAGVDRLEAKDISGVSREVAEAILWADNASVLGSEPIPEKLAILLERTREMTAERPGLRAMLDALKARAGINGSGHDGNGQEPETPTETEAERLAKEYGVKTGQIWTLGRHIVACIDSTDESVVRELIGDKVVRMVWADPPYGMNLDADFSVMRSRDDFASQKAAFGGKKYPNVIGDNELFDPTQLLTFFESVKEQIWWGADYYAEKLPDKNSGAWIVWDKRVDESMDEVFGSGFELAWSKSKHKREIYRIRWAGIFGIEQEDIKKRLHPTQKPTELAYRCFSSYGHPEDLIFDPFLGSGISILAAERLNDGRRVIGCELAPEYIGVTIHRWVKISGLTPRLTSG